MEIENDQNSVVQDNIVDGKSVDKTIPVCPFVRVVPNGIFTDKNKPKLLASVLITPDPITPSDDTHGMYALNTWPKDLIESVRDGLEFTSDNVAQINSDAPAYSIKLHFKADDAMVNTAGYENRVLPVHGIAARLKSTYRPDEKHRLKKIEKLWKGTFLNGEPNWEDLKNALDLVQNKDTYTASPELETGNRDLDGAAQIENDGNGGLSVKIDPTVDKERKIDGLYSQQHADVALSLEYGRSSRVSEVLEKVEETQYSFLKGLNELVNNYPTKEDNDASENDAPRNEEAWNEEILTARNKERKKSFEELGGNFDAGSKAYRNAKALINNKAECSILSDPQIGRPAANNIVADSSARAGSISSGIQVQTYSTVNMSSSKNGAQFRDGRNNCIEEASQRFFAIQSTAVLARLYCLTVDVEIPLSDEVVNWLASWTMPDRADRFFTISVRAESGEEDKNGGANANIRMSPPALTKFTNLSNAGPDLESAAATGDFWPVTREELLLAIKNDENCMPEDFLTQIDGFRVTGECWSNARGLPVQRFDLSSLDIRGALEQEQLARKTEEDRTGKMEEEIAEKVNSSVFHTAGLCLLDRGMQAEKAGMLARKVALKNWRDETLFATDFTIGYRMDVGVPGADGKPIWRPMHLRRVNYGGAKSNEFERIADELVPIIAGKIDSDDRLNSDASMITTPEQLIPKKDAAKIDLAVAENVVTWEGAPLGVETLRPIDEYEVGSLTPKDRIKVEDTLPFGRRLSLPSVRKGKVHTKAPPALRFGWPYCFAMRAVYSGGRSVPIDAKGGLRGEATNKLRFPGICDNEKRYWPSYFRFLRQKSIDTAVTLMPLDEAVKAHEPMGYQENNRVIVRTVTGRYAERATPKETHRIILPPAMAMDDVARHGVLDVQQRKFPDGAFANVSWKQGRSGASFPALKINSVVGFNGAWIESEPRSKYGETHHQFAEDAVSKNKKSHRKTSFSGQLYKQSSKGSNAKYYPDPFAQQIVFCVRYAGTNIRVKGEPFYVNIYPGDDSVETLPDPRKAVPVVLKFVADQSDIPASVLTTKNIFSPEKKVSLSADGKVVRRGSDRDRHAIEVTVKVPKGLSFDVDYWFVPSPKMLARKSALVQAMAVQSIVSASADNLNDTLSLLLDSGNLFGLDLLCAEGLKAVFPELEIPTLQAGDTPPNRDYHLVAPGGLPVPSDSMLLKIADVMVKKLRIEPLADVSAVATINCTHASNYVGKTVVASDIMFHRLPAERFKEICNGVSQPVIIEEETAALLSGSLSIDLHRVSGFDIIATTEKPGSSNFDDKSRRRDILALRSGSWPTERDIDDNAFVKTARQLYGFDVDESGVVTVPQQSVVLYSVRNLPPILPEQAASNAVSSEGNDASGIPVGLSTISLADLLYNEADRKETYFDVQVSKQHSFIDCMGRNVEIKAVMVPRTRPQLATADRLVSGKHVVRDEFPLGREKAINVQPNGLPPSVRPSQPGVRGPLYCFKWLHDESVQSADESTSVLKSVESVRVPVVRIPIDRSWYSAASNEKIGIVMWPPNIEDQIHLRADGKNNDNTNKIVFNPTLDSEHCREMKLNDFRDEDLGIGGQFVTRFGADAIKDEPASLRAFLDQKSFIPDPFLVERLGDFDGTWRSEYKPERVVNNVLMPVAGLEKSENDIDEDNGIQFMSVALMLYEPRFDPESEKWFIDVELTDASVFSEPFIRFGLVRYCARAREDMQVSQPAVVWAKLMPKRSVKVGFNQVGSNPNSVNLEIKVSGAHASNSLDPQLSGLENMEKPSMHMLIVRERAGKTIEREILDIETIGYEANTKSDITPRKVVNSRSENSIKLDYIEIGRNQGHWQKALNFDINPPLKKDESLFIYVEEVEQYRPASYDYEPLNINTFDLDVDAETANKDILVETGPRFACRVNLISAIVNEESPAAKECEDISALEY